MAEELRPTVLGNLSKAYSYGLTGKLVIVKGIVGYIFEKVTISYQTENGIFITDQEEKITFLTWSGISEIEILIKNEKKN